MDSPFTVAQKVVIVLNIGGGQAVVAVATTESAAKDIAEGLNRNYLEKVIAGEFD